MADTTLLTQSQGGGPMGFLGGLLGAGAFANQDSTPGILGQGPNDPKTMANLALAAGLIRGDFGGGLLGAGQAYQGQQDALLKRQDLAQQIQLRNIALQQQQQEWAAIQPALAAYAARQAGGAAPAASAPSQPAIQPMNGGPLGSGTAGISLGGQPAQSAAPAALPGGSSDPFSIDNIMQGRVIGMLGGQPASAAYFDQLKLPDAVKANNYYGLPRSDVQAAMQRENAAKGQTLVRNGSTLGRTNPDGSFTPFFTAPDTKDNANITWNNGSPVASQIPGLLPGIQGVAQAVEAGKGSVLPYAGVDAQGHPLPVTNRTAAATQGDPATGTTITNPGNMRPSGASTGFANFATPQEGLAALDANLQNYGKQGVNTVAAIVSKWAPPSENDTASYIKDVSQRLGVDPSKPLDMGNPIVRQALSTAITLHEHGSAKVFGGQTAPSPSSPAAQSSAIYAAPPMGAVPNADASQKASADSMKTSYDRLQSTGTTANSALDALKKMQDLAANKNAILTVGPLGTHQSAVNPAAAEYEKQRANVIALMAQQLGAGGTDAGREH
jgi:hypothetical protein